MKNFRLQRKNPRLCDRDGLDQVENAWILMQIGPVAPYYELGSGKTLTVPTARLLWINQKSTTAHGTCIRPFRIAYVTSSAVLRQFNVLPIRVR